MNVRTTLLALGLAAAPSASAAEGYTLTATTSLALEGDVLVQQWSARCEGTDVDVAARVVPGGKDLRFFAAPDQVAAVGVDELSYALGADVGASYRYEGVVGAQVFARLTVRCGSASVFDEEVVESLPIVVPPVLEPPTSVQRADTLLAVPGGVIPVDVEVELVGLGVRGHPRGSELLSFSITGPGVDVGGDLSPDQVGAEGRATLSPRFTANALGEIVVDAALLGVAATPLRFTVVEDDGTIDPGPDEPPPGDGTQSVGCQSAGAVSIVPLAGLLLRRRRRSQI